MTHLVLVAGADVEHGHGAVGGAVARHELLCADVRGVQGRRGGRRAPHGSHGGRGRRWHQPSDGVDGLQEDWYEAVGPGSGSTRRKWLNRKVYLLGGVGGGQIFFHLLLHGLTDVVVGGIFKVSLHLLVHKQKNVRSF